MSHREVLKKEDSLKALGDGVPYGFLVDSAWLSSHGINMDSIEYYLNQGYLERVCRGVYRRPIPDTSQRFSTSSKEVSPGIAILSLQWILKYQVHVGGESALSLFYCTDYELFDTVQFYLYGSTPAWLKHVPVAAEFRLRNSSLFGNDITGIFAGLIRGKFPLWGSPQRWPLKVSSEERATLELLNELPHRVSFSYVDQIFRRLGGLRPKELMDLLDRCLSVKVRRLFCVFAERHQHYWWKKMDLSCLDLGSGVRVLPASENGKFLQKYGIYVPEELAQPIEDITGELEVL